MIGKILLAIDSWIVPIMAIGTIFQFLAFYGNLEKRLKQAFEIYHPLFFLGFFESFARMFSIENSMEALVIIFLIIVWMLLVNLDNCGLNIFFFGMVLNRLVTMLNGGEMPVLFAEGIDDRHIAMNSETILPFLSDWILIKDYQMSIGDILMYSGAVLFASYQIYLCTKLIWRKT